MPRLVECFIRYKTRYFAVGPPEVRLVRRAFQRDATARILRDASGNPILKQTGDPFEPIGFGAPDPFVRRGRAFSFTTPVVPDPAHEFFVEARSADLGPQIPSRLQAQDEVRDPISGTDALAPVQPEIPLAKSNPVLDDRGGTRFFVYRSDPVIMNISTTRAGDPTPSPQSMTLAGQRLVQGKHKGRLRPILPVPGPGGVFEVNGPAPEGRSPIWVSLGDSLTNGTNGICVVGENQRAAYPVVLARHLGIHFNIGELAEPGAHARMWLPQFEDDAPQARSGRFFVSNPARLPAANTRLAGGPLWEVTKLFFEAFELSERPGGRVADPGTVGDVHNFAIDGFEVRGVRRQGRLDGKLLTRDRPTIPELKANIVKFHDIQIPYRDEVVAGMEAENYTDWYNSELRAVQHILVSRTSTNKAPRHARTQLDMAIATKPDLVTLWTCNNDGLQAILGGLTIQAFLTPPVSFNRQVHATELEGLQGVRTTLESPIIPTLFTADARTEALDRLETNTEGQPVSLGFIPTYRDTLDVLTRRLREERSKESLPEADIVMPEMLTVDALPVLLKMGGTVRDGILARMNRFPGLVAQMPKDANGNLIVLPYCVDFFGHDITNDFLNMNLSFEALRLAGSSEPGDHGEIAIGGPPFDPDSRVSLLAIGVRLGRRAKIQLDEQLGVPGNILQGFALGITRPGLFLGITSSRRNLVFETLGSGNDNDNRWTTFRDAVFRTQLKFREDEVLRIEELDQIRTAVMAYNNAIQGMVAEDAAHRILFPANVMFKRITETDGQFTFDASELPGVTLFPTIAGGLNCFDAVHPSMLGHAAVASEIRKVLETVARTRSAEVGGIAVPDVKPFEQAELQKIHDNDPFMQATGRAR